jgi:hypothetical protein
VKGPNYADLVRNAVRQSDEDVRPQPPPDERRLVAAVEQALRGRARRRAFVRRARGFGFAVAAALALVVAGRAWRTSTPPLAASGSGAVTDPRTIRVLEAADAAGAVAAGAQVRLDRGMPLGAGLTLHAPPSGDVRVGTSAGTSLTLESGGELAVTETGATQRFALKAGVVVVRVSRQVSGQRFIVDTRDAEVEARGTLFRIAVVPADAGCGGGSTTRLAVLEGRARVRAGGQERSVSAGESWPEGCDGRVARVEEAAPRALARNARARAASRAMTPAVPERAAPAPPGSPVSPPGPRVDVASAPARSSSLAAENDLFARAVAAKKQGHLDDAARLFGELAAAYPGGPLVESALVQRMKILSTVDPAEGARAAAIYLEHFPSGFARPEAQALVRRATP